MKININYIDNNIIISNDKVLSLEIENKSYFYRVINDFNNITKDSSIKNINFYDDNGKELELSNKINVIIDYFNIDFNSKKILNMLYKSLKDEIDEITNTQINTYYNKIKKIIFKKLINFNLLLSINEEYEIDTIFKLLKISIDCKDSLLDNLLLLIDIENLLKINELIVLVNIKQYLSSDELAELYKYSLYNGVKVLLIDSQNYKMTIEREKKIIIDSNLDEFLI